MQELYLYEYAVIRLVPMVEREEFINVGIILFSKNKRFISLKWNLDEERLKLFPCELDADLIRQHLTSFELIALGKKEGGAIAMEDLPSRFRWLTAVKSSIIQTSRPHPGKTASLENEVERLYAEYVG